jgi:hypothetical protein
MANAGGGQARTKGPSAMANAFHTIGHARHAIADFVALLAAAGVDFVVDVRAFPRSRSNPQFNGDTKAQVGKNWAREE